MELQQSLYNLIQTNGGMFKSVKQQSFLISQSIGMEIVTHGESFDKSWTDFWLLDDDGIVSQTRRQKSGKTVEKWNRQGTAEEQVKNKKSLDRYIAKLATHKEISIDAEKMYQRLCLAEFGYIPCNEKSENLWKFCSEFENSGSVLEFYARQRNTTIFELLEYNYDEIKDFAIRMDEFKNVMNWYTDELKKQANKLLNIRCKVRDTYPSTMPYTFM